jgi:hypothetical protein
MPPALQYWVIIHTNDGKTVKVQRDIFTKNGMTFRSGHSCQKVNGQCVCTEYNGNTCIYADLPMSKVNDLIEYYSKFSIEPYGSLEGKGVDSHDAYIRLISDSSFDKVYPKWCVDFIEKLLQNGYQYQMPQWFYFYDSTKPKSPANGFFCHCNDTHDGLPKTKASRDINVLMNFMHDSDEIAASYELKEMLSTKVAFLQRTSGVVNVRFTSA